MALTVLQIKNAPDGKLFDGEGLELDKKGQRGKWTYRYKFGNKRPELGLGSWPTVTLAEARKERNRWALVRSQGKNPVDVRKAQMAALFAEQSRQDPSLEELANEAFNVIKSELRQDGEAGRWMSPLRKHVFPKIGKRPISTIGQEDIRATLEPIWKSKHPTAEKAIQRLRRIFRQGQYAGYECDPYTINAAQNRLGQVIHKTNPIPSIHWKDIPDLYQWLGEGRTASAVCLQFLILTLVRVGGCCDARFEEFNGDIWTVPADRVKGLKGKTDDFRVPIAPEAQDLIKQQQDLGGEWVFQGYKGQPLSNSTMSKMLRDNGIKGKPHGFRATFRTWVQDNDTTSWEVAETILGHTIGGKTERAYARSDLIERRRPVMEEWARYVTGKTDPKGQA